MKTDLALGSGGPCAEKRRGEDVGVLQRLVLCSLHYAFNFSKLKGGALKKKKNATLGLLSFEGKRILLKRLLQRGLLH